MRLSGLGIVTLLFLLGACQAADTPRGDPEAGRVIVENMDLSCGLCHTVESAGFEGTAAPNLDEMRPGYERVLNAVREGPGMMPSYSGQLSDRDLHDIAAFISREVGG